MSRMDVSIVIPAYNEEDRLGPTVREAAAYFESLGRAYEILVVDDGSRDGTSALVRTLMAELPAVRLFRLAANRGKGHAVRTGVVNASGRLVLFADADGATPWPEFERLERAIADGADAAIGSRAKQAEEVEVRAKLYRRLIGRAFHLLVATLTVKGFADTQCGFKMFRHDVAHDLFSRMRMDGFVFDVEVLLMAKRGGYRVDEVPVNWEHQPGSRVNLALDSMRMARDLFVIRGHLIRGRYDQPHIAALGRPGAPEGKDGTMARESSKAVGVGAGH